MVERWFFIVGLLAQATPAMADRAEYVAGASGGILLPSFSSQSATDFALTSWSGGAFVHAGVTSRLSLGVSMYMASFKGEAGSYTFNTGENTVVGKMRFHGVIYHPEAFARFNLYRGYDWAPYLQIGGGYLWASYFEPVAVNEQGQKLSSVNQPNFSEGSATLTVALMGDYRFMGFIAVGSGLAYTRVFGGMLNHFFHIPITASVYW